MFTRDNESRESILPEKKPHKKERFKTFLRSVRLESLRVMPTVP